MRRHPKHDLSRMNFQVERFITFSDGVFAIVITLMVFELKVPNYPTSDELLLTELKGIALKFFSLVISFVIVGHYWSVHHRIFGYALQYTTRLLWINLAFLFSVALLPFSSGLLGEYAAETTMHIPYGVYTMNIFITGLTNCWMWIYMSNPERDLLTRKIPRSRIKLGIYRSLVIPVVFLFSFLVSFVLPVISRFIILLIPIIHTWGMEPFERRADREDKLLHEENDETHAIEEPADVYEEDAGDE